jgi:hypothetical protein
MTCEESDMYSNGIGNGATATPITRKAGASANTAAAVGSWYANVANAWGAALDRQANKAAALADQMNAGDDGPGVALQVSAASHQLAFLSTAASTASNSIGQALETLGRKQ